MADTPVLVVGAGAIGGYFGSLLARAGHPVTMLARGRHLDALRTGTFEIEGGPDAGRAAVTAAADIAEASEAPLVLFAVKGYDTEPAAAALAGVLVEDAVVLELQNGVDRAEHLQRHLGDRVLAGTVFMESRLERPATVRYLSGPRLIHFGEPDGSGVSDRARRIEDQLRSAGIRARLHGDVRPSLWEKFVLVCAANSLTALTGSPFGEVIGSALGRAVVAGLVTETAAVAAACEIDLGVDIVDRSVALLEDLGPGLRSSMLADVERSRPVEVETLNGTVVSLADDLGVPAPMNRVVTLVLRAHNQRIRAEGSARG